MNHSMINALVGMQGLQQKLDVIANNMANLNTTGFKKKEAIFHDVLTTTMRQPETFMQPGRLTPLGLTQGWGAKISQIRTVMAQGPLKETGQPTDLAIEGDAMFEIAVPTLDENGQPTVRQAWTRDGAFTLVPRPEDAENLHLVTAQGYPVVDVNGEPVRVPVNHSIKVDPDGTIFAYDDRAPDAAPFVVGQIRLVQVLRPQMLIHMGDNAYTLPDYIDPALEQVVRQLDPNDPEVANVAVRQGFLEQSNVNVAEEMAELIAAQRAYQLNARALVSADNLMHLANTLRG